MSTTPQKRRLEKLAEFKSKKRARRGYHKRVQRKATRSFVDVRREATMLRQSDACDRCGRVIGKWFLIGRYIRPLTRGGLENTKNILFVCRECRLKIAGKFWWNRGLWMLECRRYQKQVQSVKRLAASMSTTTMEKILKYL